MNLWHYLGALCAALCALATMEDLWGRKGLLRGQDAVAAADVWALRALWMSTSQPDYVPG